MKYWILAVFVGFIVLFYSVPSHVFSQVPSLYCLGSCLSVPSTPLRPAERDSGGQASSGFTPHSNLSLSPASTISSGNTAIFLTLCPHGIARCGDNTNPLSQGNMHPLHPQRSVTVSISDLNNNNVATAQGMVTFASASGTFQGTVPLSGIASGQYIVKVTMPQYLTRRIGTMLSITQGQTNNTPQTSLIAGDVDGDNTLEPQDYTQIIQCFGTRQCDKKQLADLTDDGNVDGADINLFLRELSVQPGDEGNAGPRSIDTFRYVPGNEPLKTYNLVAQVTGDQWTFNGIVPGPEIRVHQGDHVRVNFLNNLPVATTIHWHGVKIFASQDGVPGTTQNAVQPGQTFTYDFVVPDSGTYWYHTHQDTVNQLPKGLYGPLIVLPIQESVHYDRDYTVQYRNTTASATSNVASVSGSTVTLAALPGEKVRLRIINSRAGDFSGAPVTAALIGVPFQVIALDGHDIHAPQTIQDQLLQIGMAQRYDLAFTMPASGAAQLLEQDKIQTVTIGQGQVNRPQNINTLPVFDFTQYGVSAPDQGLSRNTFDINYQFTIGQNLSINGNIYPDVPDLIVKQGQIIHIHYVNNSNMTHPMHIHGGAFSVLKLNEKPLTGSPVHLDTILIPPFETADIAFAADNPGIWMIHCHVLAHASSGLMMFMKYDTVYTPYMSGMGSGNIPE